MDATRTISLTNAEWNPNSTVVHVDDVAVGDESGPAVRIEQQSTDPDNTRPVDEIFLTWDEWAEVADHVALCRNMAREVEVEDSPIICGVRDGMYECGLYADHIGVGTNAHITAAGVPFRSGPVPF